MSKFKVGDKVRAVKDYNPFLTKNGVYVVQAVYKSLVSVRNDMGHIGAISEHIFELVPDFSNQSDSQPLTRVPAVWGLSRQLSDSKPVDKVSRKCSCEFAVIWREGCKCKGI